MLREETIEEIYDGHFYRASDAVPVGTGDCAGCSACCRETGDTIVLDPWDMYMLTRGTGKTFEEMIEKEIEIRLVDGLILPNLMKAGDSGSRIPESGRKKHGRNSEGAVASADVPVCGLSGNAAEGKSRCPFLSAAGRCSIHAFRPGICRLYPLGRYYTGDGFVYILQKDECTGREKTEVAVRDWLGIADLPRYEAYIRDWHGFKQRAALAADRLTRRSRDSVRRYILQLFFVHPYDPGLPFYPQYAARMEVCAESLAEIL